MRQKVRSATALAVELLHGKQSACSVNQRSNACIEAMEQQCLLLSRIKDDIYVAIE